MSSWDLPPPDSGRGESSLTFVLPPQRKKLPRARHSSVGSRPAWSMLVRRLRQASGRGWAAGPFLLAVGARLRQRRTEFGSSWNPSDPRPEPSSKCHHSHAVYTFSLCCQPGTKLNQGRNQGSDCSHSYAKRKFQIMLASWNQAEPRPEPSSKCHHSYAVCSLSLAAPSPIIILNKRWCGHLGHQLEEIRGPGCPHPFI